MIKGLFAILWLAVLVWIATSQGNPIGDGVQHVIDVLTAYRSTTG